MSLSVIEKGDDQQRAIRICRAKLQSACSRLDVIRKSFDDLLYEQNISKDMDDSDFFLEVKDIN